MTGQSFFFISIGSNVDPERYIPTALEELRLHFGDLTASPVYETPPEGPSGDKPFWNLAVRVSSNQNRAEAGKILHRIEDKLGRNRSVADKYAPRTIDLDLLPRPGYQKQSFVMIPLADIAPQTVDEETGETFQSLAGRHAAKIASFRKVAEGTSFKGK